MGLPDDRKESKMFYKDNKTQPTLLRTMQLLKKAFIATACELKASISSHFA